MQLEEAAVSKKDERLEARLNRENKLLCQKAAAIQGRSLTDFVVSSAVEVARRTVQEYESLALSQRDRLAFVEALLNAPAPNEKLRLAAERHQQILAG